MGQAAHPTIEDGEEGWVEICQDHVDWLQAGVNPDTGAVSPTYFVPPMVARSARKIQALTRIRSLRASRRLT